jgi:hypothetical protein
VVEIGRTKNLEDEEEQTLGTLYRIMPRLVDAVRATHELHGMQHGHGFGTHVYPVGCLGYQFGGILSGAAGLCHNADRLLARVKGAPGLVSEDDVARQVTDWLEQADMFEPGDIHEIVEAVIGHARKNSDGDRVAKVGTMDADRVANARLDVVIRSAQFRSDLPPIDPALGTSDTRGNYNNRRSIVADLGDCLEWGFEGGPVGVRTPEAKRMIRRRLAQLDDVLQTYARQVADNPQQMTESMLGVVIATGQRYPDLPVIDMNLLLDDQRGARGDRPTIVGHLLDRVGEVPGMGDFLAAYAAQLDEEYIFPWPFAA